jgi:3-hydroxy-5-methyl-1-naphthoate 3-O-methyltransferase
MGRAALASDRARTRRGGRAWQICSGFAATVFDLPPVVELARERHGDRLTYRSGNFHQDDLQGPFDAILLSNIVHGESPSQNAALIERCFAALESGGWLVLKDMFIDEQGREPENAVFFGLTMLFYTAAGQSYRIDDVRDWCRRAGFEAPESMAVDTFCLVFAKKPGA